MDTGRLLLSAIAFCLTQMFGGLLASSLDISFSRLSVIVLSVTALAIALVVYHWPKERS